MWAHDSTPFRRDCTPFRHDSPSGLSAQWDLGISTNKYCGMLDATGAWWAAFRGGWGQTNTGDTSIQNKVLPFLGLFVCNLRGPPFFRRPAYFAERIYYNLVKISQPRGVIFRIYLTKHFYTSGQVDSTMSDELVGATPPHVSMPLLDGLTPGIDKKTSRIRSVRRMRCLKCASSGGGSLV